MKICYIANAGSIHTQRWVNYFALKGDAVHIISPGTGGEGYHDNVRFHLLANPLSQPPIISDYVNALIRVIQIRRLVRKIKPDIIHGHYIKTYGYLAIASRFHPAVLTAWGSDILISSRKKPLYKYLTQYTLKGADLVTCDAEHMRNSLIELGTKPQEIHFIKFGVDIQKFKPALKNDKLMRKLKISNSPTIISVRRLEPLYDIGTLIKSMAIVLKDIPKAKLVLLGEGSQELALKELSISLGIANSIMFVGSVPEDLVPQYLTSADICVSTSLTDAGPGGIIEAMACELPVITTDFGDNKKWVEDGVNGFIIPPKNYEALSSKIIYLLKHDSARMKFGQINRPIIEERNNWEKEMGKMDELYKKLIARYKK